MKCPKCQTDNRENAKYCDECGYELPTVAHIAREMFDDGADEDDISSAETIDLAGLDQMLDSSNASVQPDVTVQFGSAPYSGAPQGSAMRSATVDLDDASGSALNIPIRNYAPPTDAQSYIAYQDAPESLKKGGDAKKVFIIVLSAIIVILAALGITYAAQLWGGKAIPDVVGYSQAEAEDILKASGFNVVVEKVVSDDVEGIVLGTDPAYGQRAIEGSDVTIGVSIARQIPDIAGMDKTEAEKLLSENGYENIEFKTEKSNELPDTVLAISPEAGTRANADAHIIVTIAEPYKVPDVSGKSMEEAVSILQSEGYQVTIVQQRDDTKDNGTVLGTDPSAGSKLDSGSSVTLFVSNNRAQELEALTRAFFNASPTFTFGDQLYELDRIDSTTVDGNTVWYAVTARPMQTVTWFGSDTETRYGNYEVLQGRITWSDDNQISSTDPAVKQGA